MSEKGNGKLVDGDGTAVVGAQYTNNLEAKLDLQTTLIAKLIEESGAIVVPKDSPYTTRSPSLVDAWKRRSEGSRRVAARCWAALTTCCRCNWPKPSGSSRLEVNFISYDGGGDLRRPSSAAR